MSFELKPNDSFGKGLRRIARKQIENAIKATAGTYNGSRDKAIHEARKSCKKLRSLLRLVQPKIKNAAYRKENKCFRDAGRRLSEIRDAHVLIQTLDGLTKHFRDYIVSRSFSDVRKTLGADLRAARKRVSGNHKAMAVVSDALREASSRIRTWTDVPNKWSSVGVGLESTYCRARDALRESANDPSVEKLHEWRKQCKYLRYQLEVLRPIWHFGRLRPWGWLPTTSD